MSLKEQSEFELKKAEAEKRLNEMYLNSGKKDPNKGLKVPSFIEMPKAGTKPPKPPELKKDAHKPPQNQPKKPDIKSNPHEAGRLLEFLNFGKMNMDNDRLLILAVCLLIATDCDDELLMLALLYIML